MKITFLPKNIQWEAEPGQTILQAAGAAGINIESSCGGRGTCGRCGVKILSEGGVVKLACSTPVCDGMIVETAESETMAWRKENLIRLPDWFNFSPEDCPSGSSRIGTGSCSGCCSGSAAYGAAVDMGTTTIVVMVWNLNTGEPVGVRGAANPQGIYGGDVISRITFACAQEGNLRILQRAAVGCINKSVDSICEENGISVQDIVGYAAVGNTAMSHFLLGADPKTLVSVPFAPAFTSAQTVRANTLGLAGSKDALLYAAPNIAGHVGSDITAGILTTDLMACDQAHLFIDIGTNGEIVLTGKGRAFACSAAAGPAFEGSSISQGMRAAAGAIEKVDFYEDKIELSVIGDVEPVGICGSGIIDAVGGLVRTGIIDSSGRILSRQELAAKGIHENILSHVRTKGRVSDVVLYSGSAGEVAITQKDVREVQLAKAAVAAGISILMDRLEITSADLDKISIAGAFGSYIRKAGAMDLGLIPRVSEERIVSVGNAAGIGASLILLSGRCRADAEAAAERIEHVELAAEKGFQEKFLQEMTFPGYE